METRLAAGSTLGMLGVGQLGRMFTDAAHALGYRVHSFGPADDAPAVQVADEHTRAGYDDLDAVGRFARAVAVVTYEFENVPAATAAACAAHAPVLPGSHVLAVAQDRVREKTTLRDHGVAVGPFAPVGSERELRDAIERIGLPGVLKTAGGGYDGKGQRVLRGDADAVYGWEDLGRRPCIYEAFVDFAQELSVVAARSRGGEVRCFGPIANTHRNHILDVSVLPAGVPQNVADEAVATATRIMAALDVVGVLCVEFFELREPTRNGNRVLVNELAPRPHNSGHLTIEACPASQFEQQVRAVAGLPLGDPTPKQPAAMVNLLGDLWPPPGSSHSASGSSRGSAGSRESSAEPDWSLVESDHLHLHLYGKTEPRPGRKMGHLTALARTPHEAIRDAVEARARLTPRVGLTPD